MTEKRQFLRIAKKLCATFVAQIGNSAPYARVVSEADGGGIVKSSKYKDQSANNAKPDTRERVILSEVESEAQRDERGSRFDIQNSAPARKRDRGGWSPSCNATRVTEGVIGKNKGNAVKTFFSSLLIVFVTIFVAPAFADGACKNLFDVSSVPVKYWNIDGNTITNAIGTGRTTVSLHIQIQESSGVRVVSDTQAIAGKRSLRFTLGNDATKIYIKFNGKDADLILKPWTDITDTKFEAGETYVMSYDVLSADASVVGGFQIKNVQIEQGSTATSYVPYNPLCATCDGTIVNYTTVTENDVPAGVQNGTPSPTNPIEPKFYTQGDMVLRKVGDIADSYDATTGKITRRVGVKVLDGTENWDYGTQTLAGYRFPRNVSFFGSTLPSPSVWYCTHYLTRNDSIYSTPGYATRFNGTTPQVMFSFAEEDLGITSSATDAQATAAFNTWLAQQYDAGTPVTVYYPLATPVEEDWPSSYCQPTIKIATTAYNTARFSSVKTDLNNAVATIREIVTKTINQTAAIASLQADKQTRPEDACPAGKKCLLVETEENGVIVPHWFPIIEAPAD